MINVSACFELALAAASRQDLSTTIGDAKLLYGLYQQAQGGKIDPIAMAKANALEPAVAAGARMLTLADALLKDPKESQHVASVIASLQ